jgi:hypothetical protein
MFRVLRADSRPLIADAQPAITGFEQMLEFRFDRNMPQAYSFEADRAPPRDKAAMRQKVHSGETGNSK